MASESRSSRHWIDQLHFGDGNVGSAHKECGAGERLERGLFDMGRMTKMQHQVERSNLIQLAYFDGRVEKWPPMGLGNQMRAI